MQTWRIAVVNGSLYKHQPFWLFSQLQLDVLLSLYLPPLVNIKPTISPPGVSFSVAAMATLWLEYAYTVSCLYSGHTCGPEKVS